MLCGPSCRSQGRAPSPQTRDMNPIYTGKDVSFIDTKQAQRLAEANLVDAETLATVAGILGAPSPHRALDKAWRQLVFGAHHDGITGSESDQVYLDLLGGWREAHELACEVADASTGHILDAIDTGGDGQAAVVVNTLGWDRSDLAVTDVPVPPAGRVLEVADEGGRAIPVLSEPGSLTGSLRLSFLSENVPGVGYRTYRFRHREAETAETFGWVEVPGYEIANEHLGVAADPGRGGALSRITDRVSGFELLPDGEIGNELLVYPEYDGHPRFGEGPWNLLPAGPPVRSGSRSAAVHRERSVLGERLVVAGSLGGFRYRQVATLWNGVRRMELRTEIHDWRVADHLLRLRFPTTLAGGTPVSAVGRRRRCQGFRPHRRGYGGSPVDPRQPCGGVVWAKHHTPPRSGRGRTSLSPSRGRGGRSGRSRWRRRGTLGSPARGRPHPKRGHVYLHGGGSKQVRRPVGRLQSAGLSCGRGRPRENPFVAAILRAAGTAYSEALEDQLDRQGWARLLVPAAAALERRLAPGRRSSRREGSTRDRGGRS